jgi:hypothetical protein
VPVFDPLAPRHPDRALQRIFFVSLLIHLLLLVWFWETLLGTTFFKEETVVVSMFEEPEPEPPKLRPKVLAQRRVDTSVRRFKEIVQPEVVELRPTPVLDPLRKIEIERLEVTEAPKTIETRDVDVRRTSVFADVPRAVSPVEVDVSKPTVRRVEVAGLSAGPRKLEAAGPRTSPRAVDVEAPDVRKGVVGPNAVEGSFEGARIPSLESGASDRYLGDEGAPLLATSNKDCMRDPICRSYLEMIRKRVYARWQIPSAVSPGEVRLRFRIDRGGSAHGLQLIGADDAHLGETCIAAFRHASPFPPPPKDIAYLIHKGLIATFDYGR